MNLGEILIQIFDLWIYLKILNCGVFICHYCLKIMYSMSQLKHEFVYKNWMQIPKCHWVLILCMVCFGSIPWQQIRQGSNNHAVSSKHAVRTKDIFYFCLLNSSSSHYMASSRYFEKQFMRICCRKGKKSKVILGAY